MLICVLALVDEQDRIAACEDALHGRLLTQKGRCELQDLRVIEGITPPVVASRAIDEFLNFGQVLQSLGLLKWSQVSGQPI